MSEFECFEKELECYRSSFLSINRELDFCESRCGELIGFICCSPSLGASYKYFEELHFIQRKVALAKHKFEFPISDRLQDLVYFLDRDDEYSRAYWYEKFRGGMSWPDE